MKKFILFPILALVLIACNEPKSKNSKEAQTEPSKEQTQVKQTANDFNKLVKFELNLLDGSALSIARKSLDSKDLHILKITPDQSTQTSNKAFLFAFFTTWCEPCKAEISSLNYLAKKYKKNLRIIGVLLEDKPIEQINNFISEQNLNYEVAVGKNNLTFMQVLDGFSAIPYFALYDKNGVNIANYTGIVAPEMIEIDIQKAINND